MKATKTKGLKAAKASKTALTHQFSLIYPPVEVLTRELVDALFESGCDDATVGIQGGVLFLDFTRSAPSFRLALMSAILDVERSGLPLELLRVEPR